MQRLTHYPETRGTKPEWRNLPRRKCDNCNVTYKPQRPNSRFHSDDCRKSFHKHGGAYRKLKGELEKMVDRRLREIVREEIARYVEQSRKDAEFTEIVARPGW